LNIRVEKKSDTEFLVTLEDGGDRTTHTVTVKPAVLEKLTAGKASAEELVRRSFEFLLEREPKEAILGRFDLEVIGRYFPEYEREIRQRVKS